MSHRFALPSAWRCNNAPHLNVLISASLIRTLRCKLDRSSSIACAADMTAAVAAPPGMMPTRQGWVDRRRIQQCAKRLRMWVQAVKRFWIDLGLSVGTWWMSGIWPSSLNSQAGDRCNSFCKLHCTVVLWAQVRKSHASQRHPLGMPIASWPGSLLPAAALAVASCFDAAKSDLSCPASTSAFSARSTSCEISCWYCLPWDSAISRFETTSPDDASVWRFAAPDSPVPSFWTWRSHSWAS